MKKSDYKVVIVKVLVRKGDETDAGDRLVEFGNSVSVVDLGATSRNPTLDEWKEAKAQMENR